jgi:hypothetical protein
MTWVKIDDKIPTHPKVIGLSDKAFRVYISSICYASSNLSDGEIPAAALGVLGGTARLAAELVEAGLWDASPRKGWQVHDYLEHNRSKASTQGLSQTRREAGSKGAANRWQNATDEPWQTDGNVLLSVSVSNSPTTEKVTKSTDTERQTAGKLPSPRHKPVDEAFLSELQCEFPTVNVQGVYERATNRKTWDGYKDKRRALRDHIGYELDRMKVQGAPAEPSRGIEFVNDMPKPRGVTVPDMGFRDD